MSERVKVKSNLGKKPDGGFPLAIFEKSEEHEGGQLFIADDKVHEVVLTSEVQAAIKDGRLVRAGAGENAGDTFEPGVSTDKPLEVLEDDTPESLEKRYSKAELLALADQEKVDTDSNDTKIEIAQKILGEFPDE